MSNSANRIPRLGVVSLGCPKNLVDSERLISALTAKGYKIENDFTRADLVVINTCGFIEPAVQESFETIMDAKSQCSKIIVTGCLGSEKDKVLAEFPDIDRIIGPGRRASVMRAVEELAGVPPAFARQSVPESGVLLTPPHYAYLKIAEGCRHRCSFCIIPDLRGPLTSRGIDSIMLEARDLVARGVKEIMVISQDSSDYGFDLKNGTDLLKLCENLATLQPRPWIRLHYVYPAKIADGLMDFMRDGIIVPYLDVPLQHASERILKLMKRPGGIERTLERIRSWREACPDLTIRSNFITGFPGETEAEFEELCDFVAQAELDRVGTFPYSDVAGAQANSYADPVPEDVRQERAAVLMELQAEISARRLKRRIGGSFDMLVDHVTDEGQIIARTRYEAPDIDGSVIISDPNPDIAVREGDMIRGTVTDTDEHDMYAELDANITVRSHIPFRVR